jgi:hypothetical protein
VLVVVEHRNFHRPLQCFFDVKAFWSLDVFQVDPVKRRLQQLAHLDHVVGVRRIHLQVEQIHIGESLEQHSLAFHHGLPRQRADIPQAQDRCAI